MRDCTLALRIVLVIALVLTISCSEADRRCECVPLVPLAVGNSWVYRSCTVDQPGGESHCWGQDTIRVMSVGDLAGEDYYLTNCLMAFRETPDGVSLVGHESLRVVAYDYFFRFPVADGASYRYTTTKVAFPSMLYWVEEEVVDVPAGQYPVFTYHVSIARGLPEETLSFSPGVGLVQDRYTHGQAVFIWELVSAHLAGTGMQSVGQGNGICDP